MSDLFTTCLKENGTTQELTVHDSPLQNGVSECLNRTLLDRCHAMLFLSRLPKFLWGEAIQHAVWLKNRYSTKALGGCTPHYMIYHQNPDMSDVHEFGKPVFIRIKP